MAATDNKRIAKNTAFLYLRMILVMGVTLYTSRVVLEELGAGDFGVYTVVGGVVAMFAFISNSMTTSTQRFLNIELGRGGAEAAGVFSTALTVHAVISVAVLLLAETVGLWFVNDKLVIPQSSMTDANIVYQCAIMSFVVSIMQVPFNSDIIANERMGIYAYISIFEVALKLGTALTLMWLPHNKLAWYGVMVFAVHLIVACVYAVYSMRKFPECNLRFVYVRDRFREMLGFAGWNLFGSLAWLVRSQGMSIMLNVFLGPLINAAKGIADQVQGAVNQFNGNFQVAMNPQIIKNYACGALDEMQLLAYRGLKFSSILLVMLILPIVLNVNVILDMWLATVPAYTPMFVTLVLIDLVVSNMFGSSLMISMMSTGRIRTYQITVSAILLLILPVSYVMLRMGLPPESIFYGNIALNFVSGVARLAFCKSQLGYSYSRYVSVVLLPVLGVIAVSGVVMFGIKYMLLPGETLVNVLALCCISVVLTLSVAWMLALTPGERRVVTDLVARRLLRRGGRE